MRKISLIILFGFTASTLLKAQYDAQFSNYWAAMNYFNPAAVGQTANMELSGLFRKQWLGMPGAPMSFVVSGDMPLNLFDRVHGVGAVFFSEGIGLFDRNVMALQYAYKKKMWEGTLNIGLQAGMISENFKGSEVYIPESEGFEQTDEGIITTDASGTAIDFAIGLHYKYQEKWYAGLSVSHLLEPKIELSDNIQMYPARTYYLMGGYNIPLNNPFIELQPSFFAKSDLQTTLFDVNIRLCYNKMLWGGLGWRYGDAAILTLGAKFGKIQGGYAYDFPVTAIRKGTTGSHELFLKYTMELTPGKGNKNKHKSVRLL
ncbi:MAG: type IX secretion system membrane protein PorP/SprF [Dysgonamonadaceae bacterium]|jgi:type IX secretion system PorP/SprF family membrane protein|nr:type IX secretion system membrane protein PorP/SprF [Dysgonamonadaceae bacterium]